MTFLLNCSFLGHDLSGIISQSSTFYMETLKNEFNQEVFKDEPLELPRPLIDILAKVTIQTLKYFPQLNLKGIFPSSRLDKGVHARDLWMKIILGSHKNENANAFAKIYQNFSLEFFNNFQKYKEETSTTLTILRHHFLEDVDFWNMISLKNYRYYFTSNSIFQNHPCITHFKELITMEHLASLNFSAQTLLEIQDFSLFTRNIIARSRPQILHNRKLISAQVRQLNDEDLEYLKSSWNNHDNDFRENILQSVFVFDVIGDKFLRGQMRYMFGHIMNQHNGRNPLSKFLAPAKGLTLFKSEISSHYSLLLTHSL